MQEDKSTKEAENKGSLTTMSVVILVVFLLIVGGTYWWVSKKGKGEVVFPAGINYTGEETTPAPAQRPTYDYAAFAGASDWVDFVSPGGQYSFKYPPQMVPLIFPGDVNDTVTFDVADVPAQFNLMVLVETISSYDSKLRGKQEDFVNSYPNFFDGLKDVQTVESFKTEQGLEGWKVNYTTANDTVGTDNYFFEIPGESDKILHVNNIFPADGQAVFTRILNSVELK